MIMKKSTEKFSMTKPKTRNNNENNDYQYDEQH